MPKFKVGDKLRIRSWEDMRKEFATEYSSEGSRILCLFGFTEYMQILCGKSFTVKEAEPTISSNGVWRCAYSSVEGIEGHYLISSDMLEYVNGNNDDAIFNMADESELKAFLFG